MPSEYLPLLSAFRAFFSLGVAVKTWFEFGAEAKPEKKKGRTASNSTSKKAVTAAPLSLIGSLEELGVTATPFCSFHTKKGAKFGVKRVLIKVS